jgi:hypothetical protein
MSDDKKPGGADVLSLLQGGASADKWAEAKRQFEAAWPRELEIAAIVSRLSRARFDALKAQGFTDGQALQLTMKWMWP